MNPAKLLTASALSLLLVAATVTGQSVEGPSSARHAEPSSVDKELQQQALALLDEIITEAQSLKLPENRIRLQATSAELLWPRDKARARELFSAAMNNLTAMMRAVASDDPQYYNLISTPAQLRQQLLQFVARRDPKFALEFLRATRQPPPPVQPGANYQQPNPDLALELSLAEQTSAADPQQALRLAEETLQRGMSYGLAGVLEQLRQKSPEAADKLAGEIAQKLRAADFLREGEAANVAAYLLQATRTAEPPPGNGQQIVNLPNPRQLHVDEQLRRELVNAMMKAMLSASPAQRRSGNLYGLISTLQQALPDMERYAPAQATTLRRQLTEYEQAVNPQAAQWRQYAPLMQHGSLDALLEAAATAPPEMRNNLYQVAAERAFNEGGLERAREIIRTHVENKQQREQMLHGLEQRALWQAAQRGDVEEAMRLLARVKPLNERVSAMLNLARMLAGKEQPQTARQLVDEAANLLSGRAQNAEQFTLQLQIAQAYVALAPARAFEMVEMQIEQLNELIAAAAIVDGFGQAQFEQDELRGQGGYMWRSLIEQTGGTLAALARVDFARARADADRFQRLEARLTARLAVVQSILAEQSPVNERGKRNIISFSGQRIEMLRVVPVPRD